MEIHVMEKSIFIQSLWGVGWGDYGNSICLNTAKSYTIDL